MPACNVCRPSRMRDGSDLGDRLATCAVAPLPAELVAQALAAGAAQAEHEIAAGHVLAAALCLQGRVRLCGAALDLALPATGAGAAAALAPPSGPSHGYGYGYG